MKVKLLKPAANERYHRFTVLRESGYEWGDRLSEPIDSMIPIAMPQEVKLKTLACLMNQVYPLVAKPVDLLEACKRCNFYATGAL